MFCRKIISKYLLLTGFSCKGDTLLCNFNVKRKAGCQVLLNFSINRRVSDDSHSYQQAPKYRVIFIGSDTFSLPTLIALTEWLNPENVSVVVSSLHNVVGKCAKSQNNKIFLWKDFKQADFHKEIEAQGDFYNVGVVASFGHLIPLRIINRFPLGIFNVHASLLPRWRGASPVNHSIIHGDTETGVSIMKIAPHRFDVGPVYLKKAVPLSDYIRAPELRTILADLGASAMLQVLKDLPTYLKNPIHQDDSLATLAPKLTPEMAEVDWSSKTAVEVYRLFRGLYGSFNLRTTFNERRVDLDEIELPVILDLDYDKNPSSNKDNLNSEAVHVKDLPVSGSPGVIYYFKDYVYIRCANSSGVATWIRVKKLKIGMKWMSAKDFKNGFLSKRKLVNGPPRFYLSRSVVEDKYILRNL